MTLVITAIFGGGLWWVMNGGPVSLFEHCQAEVDEESTRIDLEQAQIVATVAAVAERQQLPARAVSIALATAYQESGIRNLDYGDRDSLGVFQQRPSQGWGTPQQILDPETATEKFYESLVQVSGYQAIPITQAAQAVQRSAFPDHYAKHETKARTLASAMTGYSPAAFSCVVRHSPMPRQELGEGGLTERAQAVKTSLRQSLGSSLVVTTSAERGSGSWSAQESVYREGRALDVLLPTVGESARRQGWVAAHWLVANADRLAVERVDFDGKTWQASRSTKGWQDAAGSADPSLVHVEVVAGG